MITRAMLLDPNHANQCFTASSVRARERQIRAPKRGILGGQSRQLLPDACYRLSVQRIHWRYKSCRATCYVTNLDPQADACKSTRPETCHNTTSSITRNEMPSSNSVKITIHWQWPRPPARQQRKPALRSITVALKGVRRGRHVY